MKRRSGHVPGRWARGQGVFFGKLCNAVLLVISRVLCEHEAIESIGRGGEEGSAGAGTMGDGRGGEMERSGASGDADGTGGDEDAVVV